MNHPVINIENKVIGNGSPTYFIADIAANHDGDIARAVDLIYLAAESGADAAKFQHFEAATIVHNKAFLNLQNLHSHQSSWGKSVYEVYEDATVSKEWTRVLVETCKKAGIAFFTSPYSLSLVDYIDEYVPAYKIGSGDITWIEIIRQIASKGKPYMLATGASNMQDVIRAVMAGWEINQSLCLMQCNTNYTGSLDNFKYINLNVLKTYREMFPEVILGLSDHTPGHATVLGAIALGASVIEKHFTDDQSRIGPDHKFSMCPNDWREMVDRSRELELALGVGCKKIEPNEVETAVLQRRAIYLKNTCKSGDILVRDDLELLRPCPEDGITPYFLDQVIGKKIRRNISSGDLLAWKDLD